jgi:hypothetical protein
LTQGAQFIARISAIVLLSLLPWLGPPMTFPTMLMR